MILPKMPKSATLLSELPFVWSKCWTCVGWGNIAKILFNEQFLTLMWTKSLDEQNKFTQVFQN